MPRPTALSVVVPDRESGLWFENEAGYLGAEGNRTVLAHSVNLADLRVTVTRVYDNNIVAWRNAGRRGYWRNLDPFARPVATRDIHLQTRKNQVQDVRLSLDDLLPEGEARDGIYQISLASIAPNEPRPHWADDGDENADADDEYNLGYRHGGATTMVTLSDIGLSTNQAVTELPSGPRHCERPSR